MRRKQQQAAAQLPATATSTLAEQTIAQSVQRTVAAAETQYRLNATVPAVKQNSAEAEKAVLSVLRQKAFQFSQNPLPFLQEVRKKQEHFKNIQLFPLFIRRYYERQFGELSPHLEAFFDKIGSFNNPDLEFNLTKRLDYLAKNKYHLGKKVLPASVTIPTKDMFRIRYTKNIDQTTADNFDETALILSIERRMSNNPYHDFPIQHISGKKKIPLHGTHHPVFMYDGPLDSMSRFYRFLLNSTHAKQPLQVVFDEEAQSMTIYNPNNSLWLRLSPHEFMFPQRLHVHLNEMTQIDFVNCYGVPSQEVVNRNLSIPLSPRNDLSGNYKTREFLYKKMILQPLKDFQQDPSFVIERRPL